METSSPTTKVNAEITDRNSKPTKTNLPDDIVTDIISRLPVKPLFQLQCLSKIFSSITKESTFIDAHLKHSARLRPSVIIEKEDGLYLIRSNSDSETTVEEVPFHKSIVSTISYEDFIVLGSCNGLVVVYASSTFSENNDCFLWNPSTNKCDYLPSPGEILGGLLYGVWGFGYCTKSMVYKIVRVSFCTVGSTSVLKLFVEILTYGTDRVWRKLDSRNLNEIFNGHELQWSTQGINVKGVVYWKLVVIAQNECGKILSFDLEKEKFALISCPDSDDGRIMEFKGFLAICTESEISRNTLDLWALKNVICSGVPDDNDVCHTFHKGFWEKLYTIDKIFERVPIRSFGDHRLLLYKYDHFKNSFSYYLYDLESNETKEIPQFTSPCVYVFNFTESLVPLSALGSDSE